MKNETKFKDLNINSFVHYVYKDDIEVKSFEIHEITKLYIKGYFSSTVISKEYFNESIAMMDCEKYSLNLEVKKKILELCKEAYITGSNDCFNIWVKKEDKL